MDKRPLILDELEHPIAPPTADTAALAPVIIGSPATAVIIPSPACAVIIPSPASTQSVG